MEADFFPSLQQIRYWHVQGAQGTGGGRSNTASCGAILLLSCSADPSPGEVTGSWDKLWSTPRAREASCGGPWDSGKAAHRDYRCTKYPSPPPTFPHGLRWVSHPAAVGEELPTLPICAVAPKCPSPPPPASTSAPISSCRSLACSSCLGPSSTGNKHGALGAAAGLHVPTKVLTKVPSPGQPRLWLLPRRRGHVRCSVAPGAPFPAGGRKGPPLGSRRRQMWHGIHSSPVHVLSVTESTSQPGCHPSGTAFSLPLSIRSKIISSGQMAPSLWGSPEKELGAEI